MDSLSKRAISLDDLIALNDEIKSLVRAGVPLERGLRALGGELPGRLGRLAQDLSHRLEQGQGLAKVLDDPNSGFPRLYAATVAAGLRSGRLPSALEGMATVARKAADLRRLMIVSLVYPVMVLLVASILFYFTATNTNSAFAVISEELGVEMPAWYQLLQRLIEIGPQLLAGMWIVLVSGGLAWLYYTSRASSIRGDGLRGVPTVAKLLHAGRMATFSDVLALMVDQRVPLDEGVTLSAEASGDSILMRAGNVMAESIRSGANRAEVPAGFPPLLAWMLVSGAAPAELAKSLRQSANAYRRRVSYFGRYLTVFLPIALSAGLGGMIAFGYAMVVMLPFYHLLLQLSLP